MRPTARLAACAAAAALLGCAALPAAPPAGTLRVRLMWQGQAVRSAVVTATADPGVSFSERSASAGAGEDGRATLALPAGSWYLSAAAASPALFGWYGVNPVYVRPGETLEITIPALPAPPPALVERVAPGEEELRGELIGEEGPVAGAAVALYLDTATQLRGPGYLEVATDERGRFAASVSPGRYWAVARRRTGAAAYGPLEAGDDFGFYAANPVVVGEGERVSVRIGAVRVLKKSGWSGPSELRTRVTGRIRDAAGRPLAGYRAFLHEQPVMLGKPAFVSESSGPDGRYLIWADREGTFYLGARSAIGRARDLSESVGVYAGSPDHAVTIRLGAGELAGLDIVVGPAP